MKILIAAALTIVAFPAFAEDVNIPSCDYTATPPVTTNCWDAQATNSDEHGNIVFHNSGLVLEGPLVMRLPFPTHPVVPSTPPPN